MHLDNPIELNRMIKERDFKSILEVNEARNESLRFHYDPFNGKGSLIPRFKYEISPGHVVHLPEEMKTHEVLKDMLSCDGFMHFCEVAEIEYSEELNEGFVDFLMKVRLQYDFEFWCFTCVVIYDKISGGEIPFKLRLAQRILLNEMEDDRRAGNPIRIILLKARQWGGSTMIQMYMAWIQLFWKENWNLAVCADVEDQARNIRGMFSRMAKRHPEDAASLTLKPYERSPKVKIFVERGGLLAIGSAQKPDSLRSFDFKMIHLSEVGLWRTTDGRDPEDLAQSLRAGIPDIELTLVALESTAKGVGNFFHREWLAAKKGSGYRPVFIPWYVIEMYRRKVDDYKSLFLQMTDYHWSQFRQGATLEAIAWYINFQKRERYSDWRMMSEFPTTDVEAFQSTGRRAIPQHYVQYARSTCREPAYVGELIGRAVKGADALKDVRFHEDANGKLQIWKMPDKLRFIRNRYAIFVDIGGRTTKADYSVIKVFDRYWMMEGGKVEVAAVWRGHLDQDLVAWIAAQIGTFYSNALLAVETNSLRKESQTEGQHFLTVLDEIADYYPNLFTRENPDKVMDEVPVLYGFHTNTQTRTMIINRMLAALRDAEYTERHEVTCDEMDTFEIKKSGKYEAVDGCKDDCVITTAGGLWLCLSYMEPCSYIIFNTEKKEKTISEATW